MGKSKAPIVRIGLPILILGVFYRGLFINRSVFHSDPVRTGGVASSSLTAEKSRELLGLSNALFQEGKYPEALTPTLQLHAAFPENHIYIGRLAEIYGRLGQYQEEAQFWEKYMEHAPRPIEACPQIGRAYGKQELHKEAIGAFERCLALNPENSESIFYLAQSLEISNQLDRAAELYEHGISIAPNYPDLRLGLARINLSRGNVAAAKEGAGIVLAKSPGNTDALLVLGWAYSQEGDLPHARMILEKGVKLADTSSPLHLALARIAEREKNVTEAIKHYQRALELDPGNRDIAARLGALKAGKQ